MAFNLNDNDEEILADINMTPLIDIMLVLLIIFMVTSSVSLESGLDIDLPDSTVKGTKESSDAIIVSLGSEGEVSVQGQKANFENLKQTISEALKNAKTDLVILEGDQASKLGVAVTVMDIARGAGAIRFAIATETK
ncbi:MAG: biopolymer transporter ExbD [Bacteriovoracaceae bacterium]|jgi:biopolymer transport protein ExbD|nr:biopolymer transporter ExbD [Bacteriovoracaceae bacterium]